MDFAGIYVVFGCLGMVIVLILVFAFGYSVGVAETERRWSGIVTKADDRRAVRSRT